MSVEEPFEKSVHARASSDILNPENWPTPKWDDESKGNKKMLSYEDYFSFLLKSRYLDLENDFRSVFGNFSEQADKITAERISDLLHTARKNLQKPVPNLLMVSSTLDLVERYMVWLYPPWVAKARIDSILIRLNKLSFKGKEQLTKRLMEISKLEKDAYPGQLRSVLDDAIGSINSQVIQDHISRGLQINRLKLLRFWGLFILIIFLIGSPFLINISNMSNWPSEFFSIELKLFSSWMNSFAMLLMGAVGGFLSGLLQARSTQITQTEYLENIIKLQLRPLIGALIALILYSLLSWQVLPGITIENAGSYFVIAFLSGFSERYFLKLIDIKIKNAGAQ